MAKYHINDEGNPGACRAKVKCPFGMPLDEHFLSKDAAREFFEESQEFEANLLRLEINLGEVARHSMTEAALTIPLGNLDMDPEWLREDRAKGLALFGTRAEILAVIPSSAGDLAVVWEENSTSKRDVNIQLERGYVSSRIVYRRLEDGEEIGYVAVGYVDEASMERSWGNDEWTGIRYIDESDGHNMGINTWVDDPERSGPFKKKEVDSFSLATTEEEVLEVKKEIWKASHRALRLTPKSAERYTSEYKVPEDTSVLNDDLSVIQEIGREQMGYFEKNHGDAIIDFSRVHDAHRGQGMGISLYVFAARKLGEKNRALYASGIQTDEAQKMWARMRMDPDLPVKPAIDSYFNKYGEVYKRRRKLTLDFTEAK